MLGLGASNVESMSDQVAEEEAQAAAEVAAYSALWLFVALLSGAFVASLMATLGGRQRDDAVF